MAKIHAISTEALSIDCLHKCCHLSCLTFSLIFIYFFILTDISIVKNNINHNLNNNNIKSIRKKSITLGNGKSAENTHLFFGSLVEASMCKENSQKKTAASMISQHQCVKKKWMLIKVQNFKIFKAINVL